MLLLKPAIRREIMSFAKVKMGKNSFSLRRGKLLPQNRRKMEVKRLFLNTNQETTLES